MLTLPVLCPFRRSHYVDLLSLCVGMHADVDAPDNCWVSEEREVVAAPLPL